MTGHRRWPPLADPSHKRRQGGVRSRHRHAIRQAIWGSLPWGWKTALREFACHAQKLLRRREHRKNMEALGMGLQSRKIPSSAGGSTSAELSESERCEQIGMPENS
jgi:hypothetical protein